MNSRCVWTRSSLRVPHSDVDQVHGEVLVELDKLDTTMTLRLTLDAEMTALATVVWTTSPFPYPGRTRVGRFGDETVYDDDCGSLVQMSTN